MSAELNGEPKLMEQDGSQAGAKSWSVQVPLTVRYKGEQTSVTQNLQVQLTLVPVDKSVNSFGVAIRQFIARADGTPKTSS